MALGRDADRIHFVSGSAATSECEQPMSNLLDTSGAHRRL